MRGDRIKCLGLRTYRTSCINATDSICRRTRMESQSVVKQGHSPDRESSLVYDNLEDHIECEVKQA